MMHTTLRKIRAQGPCGLRIEDGERSGYLKLRHHLGKGYGDDTPISITVILDSNGFDDALWCLRAVDGHAREIRLFAVWCARQVAHLMTDERSTNALDVAERHANTAATDDELDAAWADASATAMDASSAAAMDAAWDAWAAWDAARAAGAAARDARDAAWAAARDAAWAAWDAAGAARDARDAAWAAARAAQEAELRRVCACVDQGQDPYPFIGVQTEAA